MQMFRRKSIAGGAAQPPKRRVGRSMSVVNFLTGRTPLKSFSRSMSVSVPQGAPLPPGSSAGGGQAQEGSGATGRDGTAADGANGGSAAASALTSAEGMPVRNAGVAPATGSVSELERRAPPHQQDGNQDQRTIDLSNQASDSEAGSHIPESPGSGKFAFEEGRAASPAPSPAGSGATANGASPYSPRAQLMQGSASSPRKPKRRKPPTPRPPVRRGRPGAPSPASREARPRPPTA